MAATYDDTLPTDKDRARSRIGDTIVDPESAALHSDGHIDAVLTAQGSLEPAVVYLATELIARFAGEPVKVTVDGETVDYRDRLDIWRSIVAAAQTTIAGGGLQFVPATYGVDTSGDEFGRRAQYADG